MLKQTTICLGLFIAACGGSSTPTQPGTQQPNAPPPAPTLTLSGTVTATNGGRPLASATVEAATISSTTDASGRYSLSLPAGTGGARFTITGTGLLTRTGSFSSGGSRSIDLDAFALDGFDHDYFRAIARNGYEEPASLQPLRRWTRAPMLLHPYRGRYRARNSSRGRPAGRVHCIERGATLYGRTIRRRRRRARHRNPAGAAWLDHRLVDTRRHGVLWVGERGPRGWNGDAHLRSARLLLWLAEDQAAHCQARARPLLGCLAHRPECRLDVGTRGL